MRPTLAIIDPDHTDSCSPELSAFTGLDVLCHALESFTAVPYRDRITGAPSSPQSRPAYQGSNPVAEIWSGYALQQCAKYLRRAVEDRDPAAREQMCLASTAAGVGFGNAGVHLCHAMSYPISSLVRGYRPLSGYDHASKEAIVPHGLSVILTAPAVFKVDSSNVLQSIYFAASFIVDQFSGSREAPSSCGAIGCKCNKQAGGGFRLAACGNDPNAVIQLEFCSRWSASAWLWLAGYPFVGERHSATEESNRCCSTTTFH